MEDYDAREWLERRAFGQTHCIPALDPADVGVIGGIDLNLGLLNEAAEELTAAAQGKPANGPTQAAAARARSELSTACR